MKRILRYAGMIVGAGAAAWLMKDRLLPSSDVGSDATPGFRTGPPLPKSEPDAPMVPAEALGDEEADADDLTAVRGIGPVYSRRLAMAGIVSFGQLAAANAGTLAVELDLSEDTVADWIAQAREIGTKRLVAAARAVRTVRRSWRSKRRHA